MTIAKRVVGTVFFFFLWLAPYLWQEKVLAFNPFTLALAPPHYVSRNPEAWPAQMYGEFIALFIAVFFFTLFVTSDQPRWKYFFIAFIVYDLAAWFTLWFFGLMIIYFYFGMGAFIVNSSQVWFGREVQKPIPVTQVQPDPQLVAEIARRKKEFARMTDHVKGMNNRQKVQAQLYPHAGVNTQSSGDDLPPYNPFPSVSGRSSVPTGITDYTSGYSPEVFRHETRKKPVRGIRWFGKTASGRPMSVGWGVSRQPGKGGWDDIGQITASQVPTPDNASGAYMWDESMIGSNDFDRYAEPGGFAAEVDMWGQIVYHPNEKVYRGEKAKIYKQLFTYEEWVKGGLREKYKGKRSL